jgi:hypothetical protein
MKEVRNEETREREMCWGQTRDRYLADRCGRIVRGIESRLISSALRPDEIPAYLGSISVADVARQYALPEAETSREMASGLGCVWRVIPCRRSLETIKTPEGRYHVVKFYSSSGPECVSYCINHAQYHQSRCRSS